MRHASKQSHDTHLRAPGDLLYDLSQSNQVVWRLLPEQRQVYLSEFQS